MTVTATKDKSDSSHESDKNVITWAGRILRLAYHLEVILGA
jgi:hypothetical protein